ncbi:hypothetical protein STRIP9103_07740 [Streptomyces ipomoeae 91-03]|uniref:Uncharacterized protein n=1 Tax=Streptomyces ipomoeae 91-03 TaxID=698759 RepID=L1KST6_9ACTN|nr:hypothetical protein STRIP9103_07740 [Streptomyces ipomoeae 91-03]
MSHGRAELNPALLNGLVFGDASRGVRGDPRTGGEGLLTCGFARAHYVRCGRYGRNLDAEMTLVTLI